MSKRSLSAVFLALLMLSGCFASNDSSTETKEDTPAVTPYTINASWDIQPFNAEIGGIIDTTILLETNGVGTYTTESQILHDGQLVSTEYWSITEKPTYISIILLPNLPGEYNIDVTIYPSEGDSLSLQQTIDVPVPDEGTTSLIAPQYIVAESSMIVLTGQVLHESIESCVAQITIPDETSMLESNQLPIQQDGTFSYVLTELDTRTESFVVSTMAQCGLYTQTEDYRNTTIIIEANDDQDGDGILDEFDGCPNGIGESDGWASNVQSDVDQDGCRDFDEDLDDDNDGILDSDDGCSSPIGWISTVENDKDQDGCHDDTNDDDDDGDGILDVDDACLDGEKTGIRIFTMIGIKMVAMIFLKTMMMIMMVKMMQQTCVRKVVQIG